MGSWLQYSKPGYVIDVREIDARRHALGIEVQRQGNEVEIAGALAIAKQRAFDAVRAGQKASSVAATPVPRSLCVCRLMTANRVFSMPANPFDLVGINVRRGHFDGGGQVQDHLVLRRGLPTSITASQISFANSHLGAGNSPANTAHHLGAFGAGRQPFLDQLRRSTATGTISAFDLLNTTRRCAGEVEL